MRKTQEKMMLQYLRLQILFVNLVLRYRLLLTKAERLLLVTPDTKLRCSWDCKKIPCVIADDLTKEQVKAFRLADNKVGEIAEWDFNMLESEIAEIEDIDMGLFNFDTNAIDGEDFGEDFQLPDGEKPEICTMSFTLHQRQKELVEYALDTVQDEITETFGNNNKNGNALYEVIRQWAEQKKSP